jgi:hypothetical protein
MNAAFIPPWYRQPWPWILMAGPGIVIVASFSSLWLAVKSDDGVVADDYYKQGLSINRKLERVDRAAAMQLAATVSVAPDGGVVLTLESSSTDRDAMPPVVRIAIAHPTRAGQDRQAELVRGPDGRYAGHIAPVPPGRWLVIVETDSWRLPVVEVTDGLRDVRLVAAAAATHS